MSNGAVKQVIQRAIGDAAFRRQLQSDPGKALAGMDLTKDERAAVTSGDPARLTALGVDQRMSKAFGLSGVEASKAMAIDDAGGGGTATAIDEIPGLSGKLGHKAVDPGVDLGTPSAAIFEPEFTGKLGHKAVDPGLAETDRALTAFEPEVVSGQLGHKAVDPGIIVGEDAAAVVPDATQLADTSLRPNELVE